MSTHRPPRHVRPDHESPPGTDPRRLAGMLARTWLEVRTGRRPLAQLSPLVAPAVRRRLAWQLAQPSATRTAHPVRVRRIDADDPGTDVLEAAVIVEQAERVTAIAVRLERHLGRWRAVELTAPEAGLRPLATSSLPDGAHRPDAFDEVLAEAGECELSPHT